MEMANLEFDLNVRDLAVAEILQHTVSKDLIGAMEEIRTELGKINVEVEAIKVPLQIQSKKFEEMAENMVTSVKIWGTKVEDKKAEISKSEEDFSEYEAAFASSNAMVQEDIQSKTVATAKAQNTMRL